MQSETIFHVWETAMTIDPNGPLPDPQRFQVIYVRSSILTRIVRIGPRLNHLAPPTDVLPTHRMQRSHFPQNQTLHSTQARLLLGPITRV